MGDPTKKENDTKSNVEEDGGMDEDIEINENDVEEVIMEDDGELHSGEILIVVLLEIVSSSCKYILSLSVM